MKTSLIFISFLLISSKNPNQNYGTAIERLIEQAYLTKIHNARLLNYGVAIKEYQEYDYFIGYAYTKN